MRKFVFLMMIPLLALSSCAPTVYVQTLPIDKMVTSEKNVDFRGTLPGVLTLVQRDGKDSVLMSALACGIAETLEGSLGLDSASVPVFSMYADELDLTDSLQMQYVHAVTGVDVLIVADSIKVGEFAVTHPQERAYVQSQFLKQTVVSLPYSIKVYVFDVDSLSPVADLSESDVFEWSLMADSDIEDLRAIQKVSSNLEEYFTTIGSTMAGELMPRWRTIDVSLYVYDNADWAEAFQMAYVFEWEKAMNIWMKDAASPDVRKAACAAYNISVACEILDMPDMAEEWRARSDKLFNSK